MSENTLNSFAHKLFNQIAANKNENFFISPFSISTALSMCLAGAKNETTKQLKELLSVSDLSDEQILDLNNKFITSVNSSLGNSVTIKTANKIYPKQGFTIEPKFLDIINKQFKSEVQQLNYENAEESAKTINDWVAAQTNNKIKDLISSGYLNALTRLILVNAIYFKGNWAQKFDANATVKEDFHLADGSVKKVDMMNIYNKKFKYLYRPGDLNANSCELPYIGETVAMTIILPHDNVSLEEIEKNLNPKILNDIAVGDTITNKMRLQVPKFKLEFKEELSEHFKKLGAVIPFDENKADFSGINNDPTGLYISKVVHQAVVEVNEEGTEAAAATGVIMMTRMAILDEPFDFICNKPFLFMITEKINNNILFYGKYVKPE